MATTDPKNVHVNGPLTDLSIGHFDTEVTKYFAARIAPMVRLKHLSDLYYTFDQGDLARIEMALRASGAEADAAGYDLTTAAVTLERFALKKPTGYDEIGNQDEVLDLERSDMDYLLMQWLLRMDERAAVRLLAAGLWTGSTTGADLAVGDLVAGVWTAAGGGQPVQDMHNQRESIKLRSLAKLPKQNFKLVVGVDVWSVLREHPDIEAKYTGVQVGILNEQKVAEAMDIGEVIVADTIQNTAAEGAVPVGAYVVDPDDAILLYVEPKPAKAKMSACYTFVGGHRPGLSALGHQIKTWDDADLDAHVTELNAWFRHVVVNPTCGALFNEVVA